VWTYDGSGVKLREWCPLSLDPYQPTEQGRRRTDTTGRSATA
jgi:hypothetical protein